MRFRSKVKPWAAALAVIFLAAAVLVLAWPQVRLEVWVEGENAPRLTLPVRTGTPFSLWFLHSYDRAFFEEHYRMADGGRIILSHMTFKSSLNGQGFEMGTYRPRSDGSAELADIDRAVREITFRLGSPDLANHTLIVAGSRLRLLDYADAGDMLCIRSVFKPRWKLLWDSNETPARLTDAPAPGNEERT